MVGGGGELVNLVMCEVSILQGSLSSQATLWHDTNKSPQAHGLPPLR